MDDAAGREQAAQRGPANADGARRKDETRDERNNIILLAYMVNLSPRLFQEVDFVLPVYDKVTK